MKLHADDTFGSRYKIKKKIGAGSFGEIYLAIDTKTQEEVAIKTESKHAKYPQVIYEAKVLKLLQKTDGIPQVHHFATEGEFNYMVIDILGPSLEDLFNYCGRQFTLKTTIMLVIQLVERFKFVHKRTFVHRDIKPDNFLMGIKDKSHVAYIVDYGLAKRFYDAKTQTHIPYRNDKSLTGTARYASIHAHLGEELARRDDLEALGFVMLYFFKGQLPWQNLPAFSKSEKYRRIKETKVSTSLEELCANCPPEFLVYMKHCRNLAFEEKPDYDMLLDTLKKLSEREGLNLQDKEYDWCIKNQNLQKNLLRDPQEESKDDQSNKDSRAVLPPNNNNQESDKDKKEFVFASFLDAQKMIRGDQFRYLDIDGDQNNLLQFEAQYYQAYNQDLRKREIQQLKQDFQELKARGFKRKGNLAIETVKKEPIHQGPILSQIKRQKLNEYKNEAVVEDQIPKLGIQQNRSNNLKPNNQHDNKSSEFNQDKSCDEGVIGIDSKSFGAQASKFQTSPNKKKHKVIIVDDEEEKEFGINTSINNHVSNGTLHGNQGQRQNMISGFDSSPLGGFSPQVNTSGVDLGYLDRVRSQNWNRNPVIQEESEDDKQYTDQAIMNKKKTSLDYYQLIKNQKGANTGQNGDESLNVNIVNNQDLLYQNKTADANDKSSHCIIF